MSYNNRSNELMQRGMSRQQAEQNQRDAIGQGMDLNGDGYVTDGEYGQWQSGARAGGGGGGQQQSSGGGGGNSNWYQGVQNQTGVDFASLDPELAKQALGTGSGWGHTDQARYDALIAQRGGGQHQPNPSHQEAQERAHNYSQQQADAASAQQQYDQSIAEWENEYAKRDQQYTDDVNKLHDDYQTQFQDFEKATAIAMQDKPKSNYDRLKEGTLGAMSGAAADASDTTRYGKQFGNFDPTSTKRREYDFS